VLDDYYTIRGEAVHEFLNALVLHWPQPMHLVLISRLNPPLPEASLRAKDGLSRYDAGPSFHHDETAEYLGRVLGAPPNEPTVALAEQRTEGWIAGLHLAGLSLGSGEAPEALLASLSGTEIEIADYLLDEVFTHQPPEIQRFLLRTSILDASAAHCAKPSPAVIIVTATPAPAMDWVERANLFLIPLDNRAEWYRYHHLFRICCSSACGLGEPGRGEGVALEGVGWFAEQV